MLELYFIGFVAGIALMVASTVKDEAMQDGLTAVVLVLVIVMALIHHFRKHPRHG